MENRGSAIIQLAIAAIIPCGWHHLSHDSDELQYIIAKDLWPVVSLITTAS